MDRMRQRITPNPYRPQQRCHVVAAVAVSTLVLLGVPLSGHAASDAAQTDAQTPVKPAASQPGRPVPNPDPRSRVIPELVCTGERTMTVANDTLEANNSEAPLRLRLRGNLIYVGQSANTEKFFSLINRADRRRWTAGTATLVLDEALEYGAWIQLELGATRISAIRCQPFNSPR
jgi:hypothetical protein